MKQHFSTGNPWERGVGFSRAVRIGNLVETAGTVAADKDGVIQGETCYQQCCYILDMLGGILKQAGSDLDQVYKVTCYLVDLDDADDFSRAHAEYLGPYKPATTCVAVNGLFGEGAKVEIQLTATAGGQ